MSALCCQKHTTTFGDECNENYRADQVGFTDLVLCCALCREGFGADSGLLGELLWVRVKIGLKWG